MLMSGSFLPNRGADFKHLVSCLSSLPFETSSHDLPTVEQLCCPPPPFLFPPPSERPVVLGWPLRFFEFEAPLVLSSKKTPSFVFSPFSLRRRAVSQFDVDERSSLYASRFLETSPDLSWRRNQFDIFFLSSLLPSLFLKLFSFFSESGAFQEEKLRRSVLDFRLYLLPLFFFLLILQWT